MDIFCHFPYFTTPLNCLDLVNCNTEYVSIPKLTNIAWYDTQHQKDSTEKLAAPVQSMEPEPKAHTSTVACMPKQPYTP